MNSRIQELRAALHRHNRLYYAESRPEISDAEFDQLMRELAKLEKENQDFDPNSPTVRVGAGFIEGFEKVNHASPMLSLDNAFTADEVAQFFISNGAHPGEDMIIEPKIDGLSLELRYEGGKLVKAVTRGDGATGDDVTLNARTVKTIPLTIPEQGSVRVRGEVYMRKSVFNKLNAALTLDGDEPFANPRNAASGSMKQRDPAEVARRELSFIAYFLFGDNDAQTQTSVLETLRSYGFQTPLTFPVISWLKVGADNVEAEIQRMDSIRKQLDWDTDGLVFKLENLKLQVELGLKSKSPRWAVAYKFPPEETKTILNSITVQIGRTGTLTPVAELKPVHLSGSTVKRASLCNQEEIIRLGINIGDEVIVVKAAEIIPKVTGLATKRSEGHWLMPANCPCCNTPVVKETGKVAYRCLNFDCPEQVFQRLEHAVAKSALDIDGCGAALLRELIKNGVRKISDLFTVDPAVISGDAARAKFAKSREAAKAQPLWRKLHALGIDLVGKTMCKELARFGSLDKIFEPETFNGKVPGILGEVRFANFRDYMLDHCDEIQALDELIGLRDPEKKAGPLSGKTFVITGSLMSGSRDQVSKKIEDAGGTVKGSVSRGVDFLIMGEGAGNTKANAAKKLGTAVIDEEMLYKLMGQEMVAAVDTSEMEF